MAAKEGKLGTIDKPCLLLGEGQEEVELFSALLTHMGLAEQVQVLPYRGKSKLAAFLTTVLPAIPGFAQVQRIAITRDADEDAAGATTSVEHAISSSPPEVQSRVRGRFILPDNQSPGALEALWLESMLETPFAPCVKQFFDCLESQGWAPSQTFAKADKARAQVWLATFDPPNEPLGYAAWHGRKNSQQQIWVDFDHPAFSALKQFLHAAFAPTPN